MQLILRRLMAVARGFRMRRLVAIRSASAASDTAPRRCLLANASRPATKSGQRSIDPSTSRLNANRFTTRSTAFSRGAEYTRSPVRRTRARPRSAPWLRWPSRRGGWTFRILTSRRVASSTSRSRILTTPRLVLRSHNKFLATFATGVLAFECALSSRTSSLVHGLSVWVFFFSMAPLRVHVGCSLCPVALSSASRSALVNRSLASLGDAR